MMRLFDVLMVIIVLPFLLMIMLFLILVVRLNIGSPVFFMQNRAGKDGEIFKMYKFRTMTDSKDESGALLSDEKRLTVFGKWLRSTSLDELPELWNVLRGEMSLVGPRPLLVEYLPLYSPEQARRHKVRPGITGWAQVNGRNTISWEDKFRLDVWYVENQSLWLDIKILWLTVKKVLLRDGISAEGDATMPRFMGSHAVKDVDK